MRDDAVLRPDLRLPLPVDLRQLLVGGGTVVQNAHHAAPHGHRLQRGDAGAAASACGSANRGLHRAHGFFHGVMLRRHGFGVAQRLHSGLLQQLRAVALLPPRLHPPPKRAVAPGRHDRRILLLTALLLQRGLARRQLGLDLATLIARLPCQVALCVRKLILVQLQLRPGDVQIVAVSRDSACVFVVGGSRIHVCLVVMHGLLQRRDPLRQLCRATGQDTGLHARRSANANAWSTSWSVSRSACWAKPCSSAETASAPSVCAVWAGR